VAKSDAANPLPSKADELEALLGGSDELDTGGLDAALASAGVPPTPEVDWDLDECEISTQTLRVNRPISDGWRDYEIVEAERGFSKSSGNRQIVFLFKCLEDGEAFGVTVEDYAVVDKNAPKAHFKIKQVAKAVGKLNDKNQVTAKTAEEFVGHTLAIFTKLDDYNPASPRPKANDFAPTGYRG
jgi:hypothetical protein